MIVKEYKDYYKELNLAEGEDNLEKIRLYALIQYDITNAELEDSLIDDLYTTYKYLNEHHFLWDYDIDSFVNFLHDYTIEHNVAIWDIDTNEIIKEFC